MKFCRICGYENEILQSAPSKKDIQGCILLNCELHEVVKLIM